MTAALVHFELVALDVTDVVVSKLKRFSANDRADIDAMIRLDLVPHDCLLDRFRDTPRAMPGRWTCGGTCET